MYDVLRLSIKGSKLFVVFILTVIVSGSILTYLSITNLSNYRELLEKKVSEEEREVTKAFAVDFQNKFQSLVGKFSNYLHSDTIQDLSHLKETYRTEGLINYVAIDQSGTFISPYFKNGEEAISKLSPAKKYIEGLRAAEKYEFILKDFKTAERNYLKALKAAGSKSDSAYVYNALGRLYLKMNQHQKAFVAYQTILSKFKNTTNSSGFPYAYFSIIKLLKINNPLNDKGLQNMLLSFLNGLAEGTIPLNESTEDILNAILAWQDTNQNVSNTNALEALITLSKRDLRLIDNYKTPIEALLKDINGKSHRNNNADFISIKPISTNPHELMLFFKGQTKSIGFVIELKTLFASVLKSQDLHPTKFDYQLKLVEKTGDNFLVHTNLMTLSEFSPHFEASLVQVFLKNDNVINETVFKRKITYGIGLLIFLGIMVFGVYLLKQDLQREKRMHKLRADFVSNVTHELKTPLTSIYMFAEALNMKSETLDAKQKKYTNIIVKESEKLKRMINNILEFSRTESNKLSYNLELSNVTDLVNATLKEMNYFLEINDFDVHLNIEKEVFAKVDPEGLKQALSNLISNAIKYSSARRKLNVTLFKNTSQIFIEVEDFGNGIPKDKLELIFEKFYRVHSSQNETVSGTGLGLTVTKDIIEEQDGELWVESRLGKGSKFTIVLKTI